MPVIPDNFFEMVGDSMLEVVSQQMRQENKTEAEIAFETGKIFFRFEQNENALSAFQKAYTLGYDEEKTTEGIVQALNALGRKEEAAKLCQQGIKKYQTSRKLHLFLALYFADKDRYQEAFKTVEKFLLDTDSIEKIFPYDLKYFGSICLVAEEYNTAYLLYKEAVLYSPFDEEIWQGLTMACGLLGLIDKAIAGYETLFKLNPDDIDYCLGFLYTLKEKKEMELFEETKTAFIDKFGAEKLAEFLN